MARWTAILLVAAVILIGCVDELIPTETPQTPPPAEDPVPSDGAAALDEMNRVLESEDLVLIEEMMQTGLSGLATEDLTRFVTETIRLQQDQLGQWIEPYYSEAYQGIHRALYDASGSDVFPVSLLGDRREAVLDGLEDESYRQLVRETFDRGYGLITGEGTFYPVVDYVAIGQVVDDRATEPLGTYLFLMAESQTDRALFEESLAIGPVALAQRAIAYETFLKENPGFENREDIRILLMVALYKLALPTTFDGMLGGDHRPSPALEEAYGNLRTAHDLPVVSGLMEQVDLFIDTHDGIMDGEALYEMGWQAHQAAGELAQTLYMGE